MTVDANRLGVDSPRASGEVLSRARHSLATGHRGAKEDDKHHRGNEGTAYHGRNLMRAILL